jgi:hypothetical protein
MGYMYVRGCYGCVVGGRELCIYYELFIQVEYCVLYSMYYVLCTMY